MVLLLSKLLLVFSVTSFATDTLLNTDGLVLGNKGLGSTVDKKIKFNIGTTNYPTLMWDKTSTKLKFSHDGITFKQVNKALDLDTTGMTNRQFLAANGSGGAITTVPLATELDMTGVPSGYLIASDGSGAVAQVNPTTVSPVGAVTAFAGSSAPTGWLLCNGDTVPNGVGTVQGVTANYSVLYALLGTSYGAAGQLPDMRGVFARGVGTQTISGKTYTTTLGQKLKDATAVNGLSASQAAHSHGGTMQVTSADPSSDGGSGWQEINYDYNRTTGTAQPAITVSSTDTETRPAFIGLNYIIKY